MGFNAIPANDNPTKYFFHYVLPSLLLSFFIYGLYPVMCLRLGMVKVEESFLNMRPSRVSFPNTSDRRRFSADLKTDEKYQEDDANNIYSDGDNIKVEIKDTDDIKLRKKTSDFK